MSNYKKLEDYPKMTPSNSRRNKKYYFFFGVLILLFLGGAALFFYDFKDSQDLEYGFLENNLDSFNSKASYNVEKSGGNLVFSKGPYSLSLQPYFKLSNGNTLTWSQIPSNINKTIWSKKSHNGKYDYGVKFRNLTENQMNNFQNLIFHRVNSTGLNWNDVRKDGHSIIIKDKVKIDFSELVGKQYSIPIINKTDIVIGNLSNGFYQEKDGSWSIEFGDLSSELIYLDTAHRLWTNRTVRDDVYNQTYLKDNVWSPEVSDQEYIRISFDRPLNRNKDITIYARNSTTTPGYIEVYGEDNDTLITTFANISSEGWQTIFLTNLSDNSSYQQDFFDLKVIGGGIEFDFIVDPSVPAYDGSNNVYRCGYIDVAGNYQINQSIASSGTQCLSINVSDVHLDGQNYNISSDSTSSIHHAVYVAKVTTNLKNISISNLNVTKFGKAIEFFFVDESTVTNLHSTGSLFGLYAQYGTNHTWTDIHINNSLNIGIFTFSITYSNLTNFSVKNTVNSIEGLSLRCNDCLIADGNLTNNYYGVEGRGDGAGTLITRLNMSGNRYSGFRVDTTLNDNWMLYDNWFGNNPINLDLSGGVIDLDLNTTLNCSAGPNIVGGNCMGGNYYDDYPGQDIDEDGIGDQIDYYTSLSIDYHPLVDDDNRNENITGCVGFTTPGKYMLEQDIIDINKDCMQILNDDIHISCENNEFSSLGGTSWDGFIVQSKDNISITNCNMQNWAIAVQYDQVSNSSVNNVNTTDVGVGINLNRVFSSNATNINSVTATSGIQVIDAREKGVILENISSSFATSGIYVDSNFGDPVYASNLVLEDNTYGMQIRNTNQLYVDNINITRGALGLYIYRSDTLNFTTGHFADGEYGVYYDPSGAGVDNSNFKNLKIINATVYGAYFQGASTGNHYYNNLWNSSVNIKDSSTGGTILNRSYDCSELNIFGGGCQGGNYWGYPNGTGLSDTCTDADKDGICEDTNFTLTATQIDYLPLSDWIAIIDVDPPVFTFIPEPTIIDWQEGFDVNFTAEDNVLIYNWFVNDTLFEINNTGWLNNASPLLPSANYSINVSVNDTSGNINSTTYLVAVTPLNDTCEIYFNDTSPIPYPETFTVWSDCTTDFTLYRAGTPIANNSVQALLPNNWKFTVNRTDNQNYSNSYNEEYFEIVGVPTVISNFTIIPVNSSGEAIGDETYFNTTFLEEIETTNITFDVYSSIGIVGDITLYFTANGSNACSLGNKQSETCYAYDNWIVYQNGTETDTFKDEGNIGDFIMCSYTSTVSTNRSYSCQIDEHYNPNVFKWYSAGYNFSDLKWQDGINQRIHRNKQIKIEVNFTNVPTDADQYKLDFWINYTATGTAAIDVWACNSSYITGNVETSNFCNLISSQTRVEIGARNGKDRSILTDNLFEGLNDVKYFILASDDNNPNNYYYFRTFKTTTPGWTQKWEWTTNDGTTWNNLGDGYESALNINWFSDGADPTRTLFKIGTNDTLGDLQNSSIYSINWTIDPTQDYPPIINILEPTDGDNWTAINNITWTINEPNLDSYLTNITLSNGTEYTLATNIPQETEFFEWDTRLFFGDYTITLTTCENETVDKLCSNKSVTVNIYDTEIPIITIISPIFTVYTNNQVLFKASVSDNNLVNNCQYTINDWVSNTSLTQTSALIWEHTSAALPDNTYMSNFSCVDNSGNQAEYKWQDFTVQQATGGGGGNATIISTASCRYKRYGYYNLKLPWFRQEGCV